jgi:TolB protein
MDDPGKLFGGIMDVCERTFRKLTILISFFIFVLGSAHTVCAQQNNEYSLQIRAGIGSNLIGVGIEKFASPDSAALINRVRETLIEDLSGSGVFRIVSMPDTLGGSELGIFQQWKTAGASCYVVGEPAGVGNSVSVTLYDVVTGLIRLDAEYLIEKNRPWYTAHVIADDMILVYTGLRGSFASQIAYISRMSSGNDIFVSDADGRNQRQITFSKTLNMSPSWSPDGKQIAYSSLTGNNWTLSSINVDTGQSRRISNWGGNSSSPSWCPVNPDLLVFSSNRDGNSEIYTSRANGTGIRRLTNNPSIDFAPEWSPDGSKIVFASDRTGEQHPKIYIMGADGSDQHRLTALDYDEDSPSWSPRGDRIVFVVRTGSMGADIATASPDGQEVVMLTFGESTNEDPEWSPDGLRIVFTSTRLGGNNVFIMNWDGSGVRPLTRNGNSNLPSWAPAGSGNDIRIRKR